MLATEPVPSTIMLDASIAVVAIRSLFDNVPNKLKVEAYDE